MIILLKSIHLVSFLSNVVTIYSEEAGVYCVGSTGIIQIEYASYSMAKNKASTELSEGYFFYCPHVYLTSKQGIINMNRNGNFCKGKWVNKVIAETKFDTHVEQWKKFTGFSRISVMPILLCFGCFAAR